MDPKVISFPGLTKAGLAQKHKVTSHGTGTGKRKLKQRICKTHKLSHQPLGKLFQLDGDWV